MRSKIEYIVNNRSKLVEKLIMLEDKNNSQFNKENYYTWEELAEKCSNSGDITMFASGYQGESLEEAYKHLNNREKQVYIDIINNPEECEDIDDLKDIVHEIFFYDKALFAMMNIFPKDASFEELKANKIAILKDSMLDESLNEDKIADKIISNQDSKEMTRRAIRMLKNLDGDYKDLEKEFEQTYHEKVFNESLEEDLVISPEKEYQSKSGHRILIKDVTPYMSEYDGTANLRIKYDYKLAGSDEWGSSECNQYDLFKMLNEDYERNDDSWGEPYSFDEVERELKNITNNWSDEDGTIRCYYEQEKQYGVQILKEHYDIVETSDGRTGPGEEMSWVIAYAIPKEKLDESLNESVTSNLQDKIIDCLDWFIEMEMEFPKDKFLADSWEDVKDGIQMGIDPEFEVAEGIVEYFKPIVTFNKRYNKEVEEEGVFQDEIELYQNLVKAMNDYLVKNGYEGNIK